MLENLPPPQGLAPPHCSPSLRALRLCPGPLQALPSWRVLEQSLALRTLSWAPRQLSPGSSSPQTLPGTARREVCYRSPNNTGKLVPNQLSRLGFTCPTAVVGAISSLSDSSLLEESTSGLWALLAVAGGDVQAGEAAVSAFQRAGVPTRAGGPLADAGVAGAPFLGEALV